MSAGWVSVSVRARAMTSRRLGRSGTRRLAAMGTLDDAVNLLRASSYGHDVRSGQGLAEAQRAVVDAVVWNLRVLAGWAPREGVTMLRAMLAWLEVANTVDHLEAMSGRPIPRPYRIGGLGTAWNRIQRCTGVTELREVLASSPWGDPEAVTPRAVALSMQAVAADRLIAVVPETEGWVTGGAALVMAREITSGRGPLPRGCRAPAARVVGRPAVDAASLAQLAAVFPSRGAWALSGVETADQLWRAETRWWRRVDEDARKLVRRGAPGREVLVGAVGALSADAWRVRAALELVARGGGRTEDADAVA